VDTYSWVKTANKDPLGMFALMGFALLLAPSQLQTPDACFQVSVPNVSRLFGQGLLYDRRV